MLDAADSGARLCHINLARGFRGGERQTELLIRGLSSVLPAQWLIARAGSPLSARLHGAPGLTVIAVRGRLAAVRAASRAALIHAHETGGAQAALIRHALSATPYIITRRVENAPRTDLFTRRMYRSAGGVAVLSDAISRVLTRYEPQLDVHKIPDAASDFAWSAAWVRAYRERHPGRLLVGHVAAFDTRSKGQLTLLRAAARIERSDPDILFVLVGSGRDETTLREAAANLTNVSFTGWVDEVGNYLAAFDLFVLPSHREGLGSILIDAMQFGLPIVATAVGGIPDLVADRVNGLLVPPDDDAALARAIRNLLKDGGLRAQMAENNRRRARDFELAAMVERYLSLYGELTPQIVPQPQLARASAVRRAAPRQRTSNVTGSGASLCHINLARNFRGGERQTELLIRGLSAHIATQCLIARSNRPLSHRLRDVPGLTVIPVGGRIEAIRATAGAELIHAHETGGAQVGFVRSLASGTPYLITRRVDNKPSASPVTHWMYRRAARVVVLSNAIATTLRQYEPNIVLSKIPSASSNLEHDPQWVERYRAAGPNRFLVGHIAALDTRHKGQHTLIEAAKRIERTHPRIHFLIVGSGRDEAELRAQAAGSSNVSFMGWVRNVGDYLAALDIFVYPSMHEGLGSILLDAMQFGLPIVASDVGGIPDIVKHAENGLLVAAGDHEALAAAILRLFSDAPLRNAMAESNRRRAREYHPSIMTQRYLEIYRNLVPRIAADRPSAP